jgi:DNA-binding CsgD family transcriptional regulator
MADSFERLTDAQRECLRLVFTHHSTKEMAVLLGISPSAVDKRIERAVQIIGASSRFAAARMLVESEASGGGVDRLTWQTSDVPSGPVAEQLGTADGPRGFVGRLFGLRSGPDAFGRARNQVPKLYRLGVVLALMLLIAMTAVAMLTVGRTLSDFMQDQRIDISDG